MGYISFSKQFKYLTSQEGVGGKLKEKIEDFKVEEIVDNVYIGKKHLIYKVIKKEWNTLDLIKELGRNLGISYKNIGFCGMKDKQAIAIQYISLPANEEIRKKMENVKINGVKIEFVGYGKKLKLGDLVGNKFEILLRNPKFPLDETMKKIKEILEEAKKKGGFPNYFGLQRFGNDAANYKIGKLLLKKKRNLSFKARIFIRAYQSYLFNKILSKRIENGLPLNEALVGDIVCLIKDKLPQRNRFFEVTRSNIDKVNRKLKEGKLMITGAIIGYDVKIANGEMGEIERKVIEEEKINIDDFEKIKEYGGRRELLIRPLNFNYTIDKRKKAILFEFFLPKGCYATSLLREIMKNY